MATSIKKAATCFFHDFVEVEEIQLRSSLLTWYDCTKRELPWRTVASTEEDPNVRAYAVWVSEIMLQQTQVVTVVDYYNRWMELACRLDYRLLTEWLQHDCGPIVQARIAPVASQKWPTVSELASTTLEAVKEMWAGLGYYSRARRLWEGARKVVADFGGKIPTTADELMKALPGVGRYTANAIASISFGEVCGVVDGNVVRVFSRLRAVGAGAGTKLATEHFWKLAQGTVDAKRPGDFNQALMEFGATVCTPRSPHCEMCPVNTLCRAYEKVLEEQRKHSLDRYSRKRVSRASGGPSVACCPLCPPPDQQWDPSLGVMNYPRKAKKKPPDCKHFAVAVVESTEEGVPVFLIRQRPETGLLAGLWEFPSAEIESDWSEERVWQQMLSDFQLRSDVPHNKLGTVAHQFSHILHHYHSWHVACTPEQRPEMAAAYNELTRWVTHIELTQSAISTAVRKIHKLLGGEVNTKTERKRKIGSSSESGQRKRQKKMDSFLKTKV